MVTTTPYTIIMDPSDGYRRLEPLPSDDELGRFYQSEYYHLLKKGARAPDLRKLLSDTDEGRRERSWLEHTLYRDIADAVRNHAGGLRVLEIGCGAGFLLNYLQHNGFEVLGIEPSTEAVAMAEQIGVPVVLGDLDSFADGYDGELFDAIIFANVLEHVPDPKQVLARSRDLLAEGGVVNIRVPNDFNALQTQAQKALAEASGEAREPWWIAIPDHVNYFDFSSLERLLETLGFGIVEREGDFPMELFLLMGLDYTRDPAMGAACHRQRVNMEMGLEPAQRQALYRALAAQGMSRNCLVTARRGACEASAPRVDMDALEWEQGGYIYKGLRHEDIEALRGFRNAQMDVLRQKAPLSQEHQERWYTTLVQPTHRAERPAFLLVSILDAATEAFIGYGGLTYIDWDHGRAEVSFLVDPVRAADSGLYGVDFVGFLRFLQGWSFETLGLNRLFTETFAMREGHIALLEKAGFVEEGRLKEHIRDPRDESQFMDSIMHGVCASQYAARGGSKS